MEGSDRASDKVSSRSTASKRGTPNKRWKDEYDNFLIPLLVEQARKGLKCDKSFKRAVFAFTAIHVNSRVQYNVHCRECRELLHDFESALW